MEMGIHYNLTILITVKFPPHSHYCSERIDILIVKSPYHHPNMAIFHMSCYVPCMPVRNWAFDQSLYQMCSIIINENLGQHMKIMGQIQRTASHLQRIPNPDKLLNHLADAVDYI